jgi:hypothetical protein
MLTKLIQFVLVSAMVLFFSCKTTRVQMSTDNLWEMTKNKKIALHGIVGFWTSKDTLQRQIEFVQQGMDVIIKPQEHLNYFRFRVEGDSVYVNGSAANWPPYYCILNLKDEKTMEIHYLHQNFTQFNDITFSRN